MALTIRCPMSVKSSLLPGEMNLHDSTGAIMARIRQSDAGFLAALVVLVNSYSLLSAYREEALAWRKWKAAAEIACAPNGEGNDLPELEMAILDAQEHVTRREAQYARTQGGDRDGLVRN